MHQIIYISTASGEATDGVVQAILNTSRRNNSRDGITGLLISDGKRYLQALEGDKALVEAAYARIKSDPRHKAVVILSNKLVGQPRFGCWDMAFMGSADTSDTPSLGEIVDRLVAEVSDPNIRALFSSFAHLDRAKAS